MSVSPYALSVCQRFCTGGVTNEGAACAAPGAGKVCQNNPSIACGDDADCHNTPCVAAKGTCVGGEYKSKDTKLVYSSTRGSGYTLTKEQAEATCKASGEELCPKSVIENERLCNYGWMSDTKYPGFVGRGGDGCGVKDSWMWRDWKSADFKGNAHCCARTLGSRSCLTATDCLSCSPAALGQISEQLQSTANVFDELTQRGAVAACSACQDAECPKGNSNVPCWAAIGVGVLLIIVLVLVVVVSRRRRSAAGATKGAEELFSDLTSVGSGLTGASGLSGLTTTM